MKISEKIIRAYTLKNALEHDGKAIVGAVISSLFIEGLKKEDIKLFVPEVQKIINEINKLDLETQKKEFSELENLISHRETREGLPELLNVKGKLITRFSPSPSGALHIGHALALLPNFLYAQKYKGRFYVRIEDTNPENIYPKAYKMIKNEAKWLCKNKVRFMIQSERMNLYYKYIKKLIEKNYVYVCTCDSEEFKKLILKSITCPCRNLSVKEQLKRWKKMLDKTKGYNQGEAVLRFKSNLQDKNPAMRDFPLARINLTPHFLQKNKYRVWPLMNLAVTVDDIELNITHIIRGKDHIDNAKRQKMIYKALDKEKIYPWTAFIGKLHLTDFNLSSSKIREDIEKGVYSSWDDPKLLTLSSLKKQGYKPEAFWMLAEQRGISEVDKTLSRKEFFEVLNTFNKKVK